MRILVHDFGGYAFPVSLSRTLAARGHTVRHAYCASLRTTPPGARPREDEPAGFDLQGLDLGAPLQKFSFVTRWRQENAYGRLVARETLRFRPDVVLSADTPLDAQRTLLRACRRAGIPFVFWLQDLISIATDRILRRKLPGAGALVGRYYLGLERRLLRESDAVVLITDDFRPVMAAWGVDPARLHVIENWAALDEMPVRPKANDWARRHDLAGRTCLLYAGTLGMKHDPDLLLQLALHLRGRPEARVVVVSQGLGADWLRERKAALGLDNVLLFDYQPYEALPDVLGAADVLVAVLEPDAGAFSVPSKVLTYLCTGRPLLLSVPPDNLAARIVARAEAGRIVPPGDADALLRAADELLGDEGLRTRLGRNARRYAETTFDLETIADAFESVLAGVSP